jgi:hypothetical protein
VQQLALACSHAAPISKVMLLLTAVVHAVQQDDLALSIWCH